jgi:hypothetical protein
MREFTARRSSWCEQQLTDSTPAKAERPEQPASARLQVASLTTRHTIQHNRPCAATVAEQHRVCKDQQAAAQLCQESLMQLCLQQLQACCTPCTSATVHLQARWQHLCTNPARCSISASIPTGCISCSSQHGQAGKKRHHEQDCNECSSTGKGSMHSRYSRQNSPSYLPHCATQQHCVQHAQ